MLNSHKYSRFSRLIKESGIDPEITTRLKASIISIDGDRNRNTVNKFVDNEFLSVDSFAYRTYLVSITPDINLSNSIELDNGEIEEIAVPVTAQFFWPSAG